MFTRSSSSSNNVSSGLVSPVPIQETAVEVPSYTAVISADRLSITDMTTYTNTTTVPTVTGIVTPVSVQVFTLTIAVLPLIFLFSVILGKCLTTRNSAQTCNQHHQLHLIWNLSAQIKLDDNEYRILMLLFDIRGVYSGKYDCLVLPKNLSFY